MAEEKKTGEKFCFDDLDDQLKKLFVDAEELRNLNRQDEAEILYARALELEPRFGLARMMRALIWHMHGRIQDALNEARQAITDWDENEFILWLDYGVILRYSGMLDEAKAAWSKALELNPDSQATKINFAMLQIQAGELDEAKSLLEGMTEDDPENIALWLNLASIARIQNKLDQANEYLDNVEDLDENNSDLLILRALIANDMENPESAVDYAIRALEGNIGNVDGWRILQSNLKQNDVPSDKIEELTAKLISSDVQNTTLLAKAVFLCRENLLWKSLPELETRLVSLLAEPQLVPLTVDDCFSLLSANVPQQAHCRAAETYWQSSPAKRTPLPARELPPLAEIAPLRVAFLSSDLRQHSVGSAIVGLLENLPKDGRITWYAYNNSFSDNSVLRKRIRSGFDRFINITSLDDEELAARIRKDRIDILIDLNSLTADTRAEVMAYRPAPIQISWLGMPGTMGAGSVVDYILGDKWVTPPELADGFNEKFLKLPRSYHPCDHQHPDLSLAGTRADHNLPADAPVFCCFNARRKFSPETFALWGKIMQAVPSAILWLEESDNKEIAKHLLANLQAAGIDSSRIVLDKFLPYTEHLARLSHADLALDNLPFNMHATCSDALKAGVPVLTLPGKTFAGRVAAGILNCAGLDDWIAKDADDYVQKAIAFGSLPRKEMNAVKTRVSITFWQSLMPDNVHFAKLLEEICLSLYERHASGLPTAHLQATAEGQLIEIN